jgi:hypothetical protein
VDNSWRDGNGRSYGRAAPAAPDPDRPPAVRVEVVVIGGDEGGWGEDALSGPIADFFGRRIFGPNRQLFLARAPAIDPARSDAEPARPPSGHRSPTCTAARTT